VRGIRIKHGYFPFQKKIKLIIAVRMLFHIAEIQVFVIVDLEIPGNHILTVQECSRQIIYHDFSCADKPVCFRKKHKTTYFAIFETNLTIDRISK
jgi:hypothetical protein